MPNFAVRKVLSEVRNGPRQCLTKTAKFMAKITIQKKLSAKTEKIATAEQLEGVFNNPETYRKVCQIREASKKGDL